MCLFGKLCARLRSQNWVFFILVYYVQWCAAHYLNVRLFCYGAHNSENCPPRIFTNTAKIFFFLNPLIFMCLYIGNYKRRQRWPWYWRTKWTTWTPRFTGCRQWWWWWWIYSGSWSTRATRTTWHLIGRPKGWARNGFEITVLWWSFTNRSTRYVLILFCYRRYMRFYTN